MREIRAFLKKTGKIIRPIIVKDILDPRLFALQNETRGLMRL
jgi:hypothetical protein